MFAFSPPVWNFRKARWSMPDGSVVLVEIRGQRLTRVWPDGRKEVVAQIPGGPNGAAIGPDGKMLHLQQWRLQLDRLARHHDAGRAGARTNISAVRSSASISQPARSKPCSTNAASIR